MRIVALVLLLPVGGCTPSESRSREHANDTSAYEKDCMTPPDSAGACVLRDQRVH